MIGELVKRPASKHQSNLRPITGEASEENKRQSNECFELAKKHMIKKQYDVALKHYTNATIHNPSNHKALCNMGMIYKERNKFSEARSCYHKALFANPFDPIALYNLANLERVLGNDELAIGIYAKVTNLKQGQNMDIGTLHYDAYLNKGICFKNLQLFDKAIECNDKAIQISPNDEPAYFNKSMCILKKIYSLSANAFTSVKKKLCQEIQPVFKKVLAINPNNFTVKIGLIQLHYLQEPSQTNFKQALKEFQQLEKTAPQSQKYQLTLKINYCKNQLKKLDEAKIILPPKQDVVEFKQKQKQKEKEKQKQATSTNKYDNQTQEKNEKKQQKPASDINQKLQQKKPQQKRPESKRPESKRATSQREKRQTSDISAETKQKLKDGKSVRALIDALVAQKKFEQAFDLSQTLPDGMEKYQAEIIINFSQCVEERNDTFLESAIAIYEDFFLKNNQNTPITRDMCSEKGHQAMATMLTVYGNFAQASKHYEVLLQIIQDQKFGSPKTENQQKIKQIHAELGVCYAERGLLREAISEYSKSLQMQPDNYFLMTNLCGLLIQDGNKKDAKKLYEDYLHKNGGEQMGDKVAYIDSLLNISICVRETPEEQQAVDHAIEAIQKYFPTFKQIQENLHEEAILGLYLRQAEMLELQSDSFKGNSNQKSTLYKKMIETYMSCLQFENCPDREAIYINTGILFYLSGCYANALSYYNEVLNNRKAIYNNFALTLLHLHEYQRGAQWLQMAIQQNPQNTIYVTNFEIVKWMCGIGDRKVVPGLQCKCESMYETRVLLGLWMIDQLTLMIDQNEIDANFNKGEKVTQESIDKIVAALLQRIQKPAQLKDRAPQWVIKSKVLIEKLQTHMKSCVTGKEQSLITDQIVELCLKKCSDGKQLQQSLSKAFDFLNTVGKNPSQFSIIQTVIGLIIIRNSHIADITEIVRSLIAKKQIHSSKQAEHFESAEFTQLKKEYIQAAKQLHYPKVELRYEQLENLIMFSECLLENGAYYDLDQIENVYYQEPGHIVTPLVREYNHPHCSSSAMCIRCIMGASALYSSIFDSRIKVGTSIGKKWSTRQEIQAFSKTLTRFVVDSMESEARGVFSKKTNLLTLRLEQPQYPITIKTHHNSFQGVQQFMKRLDPLFSIKGEKEQGEKGVRVVAVNKCITFQLFWGEKVTAMDRFCHWLSRRRTDFVHDAVLFLGEDLNELTTLFQSGQNAITKITTQLYGTP